LLIIQEILLFRDIYENHSDEKKLCDDIYEIKLNKFVGLNFEKQKNVECENKKIKEHHFLEI